MKLNMAIFFHDKLIRLVFSCYPFYEGLIGKNKVYLKTEKPYIQYFNLSRKLRCVYDFNLITYLP
jgi:hypothetical protein